MNINTKEAITFDDVLIEPSFSSVESRTCESLDVSQNLGGIQLNKPIISANMDTVTGFSLATEMRRLGSLGIFHRFYKNLDEEMHEYERYQALTGEMPVISVGVKNYQEKIRRLLDIKPTSQLLYICVDVAHGYSLLVENTIKDIKRLFDPDDDQISIIAGNVAGYDGARFLVEAGANIIKVGIGNSGVCSTRLITGCGVPQLTAISESRQALNDALEEDDRDVYLIADGGIRYPADFCKAIAAGADAVMMGRIFASCYESCNNGIYRGQSSAHFQKDYGNYRNNVTPEGIDIEIYKDTSAEEIINHYIGGLKSSMSYVGARNLIEYRKKCVLRLISHHGYQESLTYAKK